MTSGKRQINKSTPNTFYTPTELRLKLGNKKWVMGYNRIIAVVDPVSQKVMYIEDYGPRNGFFIEGWRALHFPLTSSIVEKSYREGGITIYIIKQGKAKLNLLPSFAPIGIEECKVINNKVSITFAGFGGGGVSASFSRGMTEGVEKVQVIQQGGGNKLGIGKIFLPAKKIILIGVDDTDNENEGATYALAHNIATDIAGKLNVFYATHNNIQLFPYNPYKTKNCMATVVSFIYDHDTQEEEIVKEFAKLLKKHSVSNQAGMATFKGFSLPRQLIDFSTSIKFHMLHDMDELKKVCNQTGVKLYPITGEKGLIGAAAALGFFDRPDFGAKLPNQCC
ncbi:hypothetical protein A3J19_01475 [Candidatus Daviesbacteria bacterium RIFCSPLOWO2_02_FULL_41_8]|uniref:TiaS-like TCKD domain-containing protein n=3 Tax=Candidatus Daviesiibacteriota TaxID=1752718 RepID=A0A1F5NHM2_9BACT|nr:MAG: hypothetical protein A2871_01955 [Candidatus Daviesbacteria bacterium RIFCSPHIGHO2_01_FULL_41_23]OGE33072.1 MAG: hypothetical protein A3D83_02895 [Candidatus Daviesbacteria bacterium RIFCSPHIGHO2_02_FULL_41_10]OGE77002.1 MAG: hypothetical protein A3J19_01475 [Candidatus Daviesbacteria bacterium RIFCSPLOWO2_02_FULL_41_8]